MEIRDLTLKRISGKAEVYLAKKLMATKTNGDTADLKVELPAGKGERVLTVLIEGEPGQWA